MYIIIRSVRCYSHISCKCQDVTLFSRMSKCAHSLTQTKHHNNMVYDVISLFDPKHFTIKLHQSSTKACCYSAVWISGLYSTLGSCYCGSVVRGLKKGAGLFWLSHPSDSYIQQPSTDIQPCLATLNLFC